MIEPKTRPQRRHSAANLTSDPPLVEPERGKLAKLVPALLDLLRAPTGQSSSSQRLGWFTAMAHVAAARHVPMLDATCAFVRTEPQDEPVQLPFDVQ